jgi:hypothetical protein
MRNTTRVVAALAAVAASLAFGVSQASALQWSSGSWASAMTSGTLTFERSGQTYTATCSNVELGLHLANVGGQAQWSLPGANTLDCVDSRGPATQTTIDLWFSGTTASVGGSPVMNMAPSASSWWTGPFAGNAYRNLNPGTITLDVVNGNTTTPTKIVFNHDKIGTMSGGGDLYATGQLSLAEAFIAGIPLGNPITLN